MSSLSVIKGKLCQIDVEDSEKCTKRIRESEEIYVNHISNSGITAYFISFHRNCLSVIKGKLCQIHVEDSEKCTKRVRESEEIYVYNFKNYVSL